MTDTHRSIGANLSLEGEPVRIAHPYLPREVDLPLENAIQVVDEQVAVLIRNRSELRIVDHRAPQDAFDLSGSQQRIDVHRGPNQIRVPAEVVAGQANQLVGVELDVEPPQPVAASTIPQRDLGPSPHASRARVLPERHQQRRLFVLRDGSIQQLTERLALPERENPDLFCGCGEYGV
jgi:hypothetical protein